VIPRQAGQVVPADGTLRDRLAVGLHPIIITDAARQGENEYGMKNGLELNPQITQITPICAGNRSLTVAALFGTAPSNL
jgi:hypothetical protein